MSFATSVLQSFDDYIHTGVPILRQWFLLRSIKGPVFIASLYVLFVKVVGPALMRNRKPYELKYPMFIYNLGLVIYYLYFVIKGVMFLPDLGTLCFCGQLNISMGPAIEKFLAHGWQLYMIKYVELLDTIFLVLRKKFHMITTLHVTHHAVVPIFAFLGLRSETNAYFSVFMVVNSIIHIIMYTYYGIAILGPQYQKYLWWKKYLTLFQILQFLVMTIYMLFMGYIGCITSTSYLYVSCGITVLFFFLFINYYRRTFVDNKPNRNGSVKLPYDCLKNHNASIKPQELEKKLE